MKLGNGENLIKQYDYCSMSDGRKESLVLTNRRAISIHTNKRGEDRTEIRVKDVKTVDSSYKHKKKLNPLGLFVMIIGLVLLVLGIVLSGGSSSAGMDGSSSESGGSGVNIILILLGLVAFVGGIFIMIKFGKDYKTFYLTLSTEVGNGRDLTASASNGYAAAMAKKGKFAKFFARFKKSRKVKVQIEESLVYEMMDEIGSTIFELQDAADQTIKLQK